MRRAFVLLLLLKYFVSRCQISGEKALELEI